MFKPEDFELSLEKQLKKKVIMDEVNECTDVETLRTSLIAVTDQLMKYQQLLDATLKQLMDKELAGWAEANKVKIVEDSMSSTDG